jgi:indoleamine 2,3-dioxygenase
VTGTKDEEWFYLISVALESRGGPIIRELLQCMEAAHAGQDIAMVQSLQQTTLNIQRIGQLLERMYERCDPQTYYHDVRPFLAGTKGMAASGLPNGVYFDYGNDQGEWLQYSGGSNGQSSLIQLLDIALGVDHYATGERGRSSDQGIRNKANGYMQDMRNYMPGRHREFLAYVEKTTDIRGYATGLGASEAVRSAYKETVTALSKFRDIHIQIVTRYIITPSRNPPAAHVRRKTGINLATASSTKADTTTEEKAGLKGTGGTDLMPFLKQTRDETREAASMPSPRPRST